jgi:uncharacterized phosphatase
MVRYFRLTLCLLLIFAYLTGCGGEDNNGQKKNPVSADTLLHVYLIRHGQAYKNIPHPADTPAEKLDSLTARGELQAAAAGKLLKSKRISIIISSPARRTLQTAEAVRNQLINKIPVIVDSAFAPLTALMNTTDMTAAEKSANRDTMQLTASGKVFKAISRYINNYAGQSVIIVTHGDVCNLLIAQTERSVPPGQSKKHEVPPGSVSEILITKEGWIILKEGIEVGLTLQNK